MGFVRVVGGTLGRCWCGDEEDVIEVRGCVSIVQMSARVPRLRSGAGGLTVLKVGGVWEICFLQGEKQDLRNEKIERLIFFVFIIP